MEPACYSATRNECTKELQAIWKDLEVSTEDQEQELQAVSQRALKVWNDAVKGAEDRRAAVRQQTKDSWREVRRIQLQLTGKEGAPLTEDEDWAERRATVERSLMTQFREAQSALSEWQAQKAERLQEHDQLQGQIAAVRRCLGQATPSRFGRTDISGHHMAHLQAALAALNDEKAGRISRMEGLLQELRSCCTDVGEDDAKAMVEAHPSMEHFRLRSKEEINMPLAPHSSPAANGLHLSDAVFHAVDSKVEQMRDLKAMRERRATEMLRTLDNLWTKLSIAADEPERMRFVRLLTEPSRLHTSVLQTCTHEVARLEHCKTQLICNVVAAKHAELAAAHADMHLPPPPAPELPAGLDAEGGADHSRQVSDVLGKVVRQLGEATALAAKRAPLLAQIQDLAAQQAECEWLAGYERDENRFRGRDANRNLQRALKAERVRERLPSAIASLHQVLAAWRAAERCPFLYDGQDYQVAVLDVLQQRVEEAAERRAQQAKQKRAALPRARPGSAAKPKSSGRTGAGSHGKENAACSTATKMGVASRHSSRQTSPAATPRKAPATPARPVLSEAILNDKLAALLLAPSPTTPATPVIVTRRYATPTPETSYRPPANTPASAASVPHSQMALSFDSPAG